MGEARRKKLAGYLPTPKPEIKPQPRMVKIGYGGVSTMARLAAILATAEGGEWRMKYTVADLIKKLKELPPHLIVAVETKNGHIEIQGAEVIINPSTFQAIVLLERYRDKGGESQ